VTDSQLQELIRAIDQADSPARLIGAVRALAAARLEAAIPTLIQVLGYNNPGAAVAAVDGLVKLGEGAVQPLLEQIDGYNYGARAYAIRALAAIADPRALDVLLEAAATDFAPSVRRAATKGVGFLRWEQFPDGQLSLAQARALATLLQVSQDADWAIRYAAIVGLQALAANSADPAIVTAVGDRLQALVQADPDGAVRARVFVAQTQLNSATASLAGIGC